jgi:hypothetical protein
MHSSDTGKKMGVQETVRQLSIDLKKAYDSVRKGDLHNILIEFWVPMKLVRLIEMFLNEMYNKVLMSKYLSDSFPFQMV